MRLYGIERNGGGLANFKVDQTLSKYLGADEVRTHEYRWTRKHSRYKTGQQMMQLDDTGYHDSEIEVVDSRIIENGWGEQFILTKQVGTRDYYADELVQGKLRGT